MILKPTILAEEDDPALEILKSAGVVATRAAKSGEGNQLAEILNSHGLGLESLVDRLSDLAANGVDKAIQFRAIEKGLQLHGVGKEESGAPTINIMIVPREIKVNLEEIPPILLPRQLDVSYEVLDSQE